MTRGKALVKDKAVCIYCIVLLVFILYISYYYIINMYVGKPK